MVDVYIWCLKYISLELIYSFWLKCRWCLILRAQLATCPWWRHQMETFSALLALCAGNSPVTGEFRAQRPVTRSFDAYFDLRLNKRCKRVNNRKAGDLRRNRVHYDVIVMSASFQFTMALHRTCKEISWKYRPSRNAKLLRYQTPPLSHCHTRLFGRESDQIPNT